MVELYQRTQAREVVPEFELFDLGHVTALHRLLDTYGAPYGGRVHCDLVMGVPGGMPGTAAALVAAVAGTAGRCDLVGNRSRPYVVAGRPGRAGRRRSPPGRHGGHPDLCQGAARHRTTRQLVTRAAELARLAQRPPMTHRRGARHARRQGPPSGSRRRPATPRRADDRNPCRAADAASTTCSPRASRRHRLGRPRRRASRRVRQSRRRPTCPTCGGCCRAGWTSCGPSCPASEPGGGDEKIVDHLSADPLRRCRARRPRAGSLPDCRAVTRRRAPTQGRAGHRRRRCLRGGRALRRRRCERPCVDSKSSSARCPRRGSGCRR